MAYILIFLLIFFIVVPVVRVMYKVWVLRRQMRRFMEDPFGAQAFGQQPHGGQPPRDSGSRRQRQNRRGKKIPRDVGEYVAFTEYEGHTETAQTTSGRHVRTESQITDVEWVDIEK